MENTPNSSKYDLRLHLQDVVCRRVTKNINIMKTILKTIRLKPSLIKQIEEMAKNENRNFNNMVETLLIREITKKKLINKKAGFQVHKNKKQVHEIKTCA